MGIKVQSLKASPVKPSGQEQIGMWLETEQIALIPQVPGQGSEHLFLIQALYIKQSLLTKHSGRQPSYGLP